MERGKGFWEERNYGKRFKKEKVLEGERFRKRNYVKFF